MPHLIIQPAGGHDARQHFADTIDVQFDIATHADLLGLELAVLQRAHPSGQAPIWGVTPGVNGANSGKYERAEPGDVVLFTGSNHAFAGGVVIHKWHSELLAERLWGRDELGQTWEYMYALSDVWPLDIAYAVSTRLLGMRQATSTADSRSLTSSAASGCSSASAPQPCPS